MAGRDRIPIDDLLPESCRLARERMARGAEALPAADRTELERHLAGCADCSALVESISETSRSLSKVRSVDPPERLMARLRRIPSESFPCHRFDAEAAALLEARDRGEKMLPSGDFASHLGACAPCATAWRALAIVGTLPEVGPRRELFRRLSLRPALERRNARGEELPAGTASIPIWKGALDKVVGDIRWTVAVAWMLAIVVMLVAGGNPASVARQAASEARSAAGLLARKIPTASTVDRPNAEIEAARLVAKTRAIPVAYAKAGLVALRNRVFGFSPEPTPSRSSPSRAPGAFRKSTAPAGAERLAG